MSKKFEFERRGYEKEHNLQEGGHIVNETEVRAFEMQERAKLLKRRVTHNLAMTENNNK